MIFLSQVYWLLRRQWYLVNSSLTDVCINYALLWPCIFSVSSGYFVPLVFFPDNPIMKGTELMLGMVLLQSFVLAYFMAVDLVSERETSGIFSFHATATSFGAAFTARLIFYVLYAYAILLPFLPVAKLLLGANLYTNHVSWGLLSVVLFCIAATVVSYVFCLVSLVRNMRSIEHMWSYGVEPILWLSGMWAPAYAIARSGVPGIKWFLLINPFVYASDSLRQLFFSNDARFADLGISLVVMVIATSVFSLIGYIVLKRQVGAV